MSFTRLHRLSTIYVHGLRSRHRLSYFRHSEPPSWFLLPTADLNLFVTTSGKNDAYVYSVSYTALNETRKTILKMIHLVKGLIASQILSMVFCSEPLGIACCQNYSFGATRLPRPGHALQLLLASREYDVE